MPIRTNHERSALISHLGQRPGLLLIAMSATLGGCNPDAAPDTAEVELIPAVPDLTIGRLEGDGPDVFSSVGSVVGDSLGRVFVADYQSAEIRVFDSTGAFLFRFGRNGEGPGELTNPCCLAWGPDGLLWVRDGENHRYSAYEVGASEASFRTSARMVHYDSNFFVPTTFTALGDLIDVGHSMSPSGQLQTVRFTSSNGIPRDSTIIPEPAPDEIGMFTISGTTEEGGQFVRYFWQPFGPQQVVAHGPRGTWARAVSSTYAVELIGNDSTLVLTRDVAEIPLSEAEKTRGREQLQADAERAGSTVSGLPYGLPDRKPPLRGLFFDDEGRLWVERSVPNGSPRVADVWDRNGKLLRSVRWPEEVTFTRGWVSRDWALGLRQDSLGVDYVVRLRFRGDSSTTPLR